MPCGVTKPRSRMTIGEAEKIIRKIKVPKTKEEQAQFSQATFTILRGVQKGLELTDILGWSMDLIKEGDKIKKDLVEEDLSPEEALVQESLMASITNSLIMITSILSEAKGIDPEKDFIDTAEGTKTNIIFEDEDEDEDNWMSYGYGED